jgi:uncharacterized membrane protein YccC
MAAPAVQQGLKAGLAAVIALLVAQNLRIPMPIWAPVTAIVIMNAHIGDALRDGGIRLVGTAVGVVIAALFVSITGAHIWTLGIAVAVAATLCVLCGLQDAVRVSTVAAAIVVLADSTQPWSIAASRFLANSVGIIVAVLVGATLWPTRAITTLRRQLAANFRAFGIVFAEAISVYVGAAPRGQALDSALAQLEQCTQELVPARDAAVRERFLNDGGQTDTLLLAEQCRHIGRHLSLIGAAANNVLGDTIQLPLAGTFQDLAENVAVAFDAVSENIIAGKHLPNRGVQPSILDDLNEAAMRLISTWQAMSGSTGEYVRLSSVVINSQALVRDLKPLLDRSPGSQKQP